MSPSPFRSLYTSPAAPTPLWISTNFTESRYAVYLTDFVHLWVSSQTKRGISYLYEEEGGPIDPDVDEGNLKLLLETLEKALNNTSGDSPRLVRDPDLPRAIILKTVTELPKPNPPLKWNFVLKPATPEQLSEIVIKPFVKLSGIYRDKITELEDVVREKDVLIQKLVEIAEESGTNVKDSVGHSRRRALKKYTPGAWTEPELGMGVGAGAEWRSVVPAVSQARNEKSNEWWLGLGDGTAREESGSGFTGSSQAKRRTGSPEQSEQRLAKSRDSSKPLKKREPSLALADTDDEDDDFVSQRSPSPSPIRHKAQRSASPAVPPKRKGKEPSKPAPPTPEEEETASEDDLNIPMHNAPAPAASTRRKTKSPSPSPPTPPPQPRQAPAKKKLGSLGKKAAPAKKRSPSPPRVPSSSTAPIPPSPAKRKLGALGGLAKKRKSEEPEVKEEPKMEVVVPQKTEEEILEEEAEKKRQELAEKLERDREKAAKKVRKRKF